MKTSQHSLYQQIALIVVIPGVWALGTKTLAQSTDDVNDPNQLLNPPIVKRYHVSCECLSLDPNRPMESYKRHSSGWGGAGSKLGHFFKDDTRSIEVDITSQFKDKRFLVQVQINPFGNDTVTQARTIDLDLTDLQARSVEIARNADGRVYWINMTPSIKIIDRRAKRLQESALQLTQWHLVGSPVVINESVFAGNMGVSGGTIAFVDYRTIGRIDFALVPFKGAEPSGILFNGRLTLRHQDQSVDIYGVQNGSPAMRLPGGPYTIWAKWTEPSENQQTTEMPSSVEEFIQVVKAQFVEKGLTPPSDEELRASYEQVKNNKQLGLGSGVRGMSKSERID